MDIIAKLKEAENSSLPSIAAKLKVAESRNFLKFVSFPFSSFQLTPLAQSF
jgi:hypothetical protein